MAHDTPDDPSQIWELCCESTTEYDTDDMPGYGPEFMSDWTFDPELFTSSSTSDLACATMDHCVVVGSFTNTDVTLPYIKTKHDGTWGYAERVPGVPYPNFAIGESDSASSYVNSVACPALDACVAIGGVRQSGASTSDARAIVVEQHAVTVIAPTPPRNLTATSNDDAVTVTWEPPTAGMDSPVDYTVTLTGASSVMTCTATAPATQCVANGLAGGNYRVTATATNRFGTSWGSAGTDVTVTTTTSPTVPTVPTVPATPPATPPAVTPVEAGRLYESRSGASDKTFDGAQQGVGRTLAGKTATINVTGRAGVPNNATAVFLNVVAANPSRPGYLTVFPCGTKQPLASNVNYNGNDISSNAVLAKIGTNGNVCVYTSADTDLIIDVNGYVPASGSPNPISPARLYESRSGASDKTFDGAQQGVGRTLAGKTATINITGRAGVPNNATAVFLNVVAANPSRPRLPHRVPLRHQTTPGLQRQLQRKRHQLQRRPRQNRHQRQRLRLHIRRHRPHHRRQRLRPRIRITQPDITGTAL